MRRKFIIVVAFYVAFFGAWSLGGEIVDCWRGVWDVWFPVRLLASAIFAAVMVWRLKKGGDW
jgi:hypothetical protein